MNHALYQSLLLFHIPLTPCLLQFIKLIETSISNYYSILGHTNKTKFEKQLGKVPLQFDCAVINNKFGKY